MASAWGFGGSYGKSGYMLFYERRKKKPIRVVAPEAAADTEFEEKTNEHIKLVPYDELVEREAVPNEIYSKVSEDNKRFSFENDVYSQEFFNFVRQILVSVAAFREEPKSADSEILGHVRWEGLQIAQKAGFEILARCYNNTNLKDLVRVFIELLRGDDALIRRWMTDVLENERVREMMLELLIESVDNIARGNAAYALKFALCRLKMLERNELNANERETVKLDDGTTIDRPVALSARFIELLVGLLNTRVARQYTRFEQCLDVIASFALYSPEQVEAGTVGTETRPDIWDAQAEASQVGLRYFFASNMLERIIDFMLGPKSPLKGETETRINMSGGYVPANFHSLMKVVTAMIGAGNLFSEFPLSDACKNMLKNKEVLGKLVESNAGNKDFGAQLSNMCADNVELTRKLAKIFVVAINQPAIEKQTLYLRGLKKFLRIEDSLKWQRLQWVFGVA